MRWYCPKVEKRKCHTCPTSTLFLGDTSTRQHLPKATEAFSKLYYAERILPVVQACSGTHKGVLITLIAEVTKELYDTAVESKETKVIDAVAAYIAKAKATMEGEGEDEVNERTPQEYQEYINIYFDNHLIAHVHFIAPSTN